MHESHAAPQDDCRDLLRLLPDYIEGQADADLCARIEVHLAECRHCRVVVDTLENTIKLYHTLPDSTPSADARERLFSVLRIDVRRET
jgi:predicted anti-sigma-YlaC factor YlaD